MQNFLLNLPVRAVETLKLFNLSGELRREEAWDIIQLAHHVVHGRERRTPEAHLVEFAKCAILQNKCQMFGNK